MTKKNDGTYEFLVSCPEAEYSAEAIAAKCRELEAKLLERTLEKAVVSVKGTAMFCGVAHILICVEPVPAPIC